MNLQELDRLLDPTPMPLELGYERPAGGSLHIACRTDLRGCTDEMFAWWFRSRPDITWGCVLRSHFFPGADLPSTGKTPKQVEVTVTAIAGQPSCSTATTNSPSSLDFFHPSTSRKTARFLCRCPGDDATHSTLETLMRTFKHVGHLAVALALSSTAYSALAQTYPNKPIRLIMGDAPGGVVDRLVRPLANKLSEKTKQPIIVENKVGADGMIALDACAKAPNDGTTICAVTVAHMSVVPNLRKVPVEPLVDIAPITPMVQSVGVIYVNPKVPASNLAELTALAKSKPGSLTYASFGNGSIAHLVMESLKREKSVDLLHVPYTGGPPALNAVMGGTTDVGYFALGGALPNLKAGRIKPIAVFSNTRSPMLPEVPTAKEGGFEFFLTTWFGLVAPKGTPEPLRELIAKDVAEILNNPEFKSTQVDSQSYEVFTLTPSQFAAQLKTERERVSKFVQATGIKAD